MNMIRARRGEWGRTRGGKDAHLGGGQVALLHLAVALDDLQAADEGLERRAAGVVAEGVGLSGLVGE